MDPISLFAMALGAGITGASKLASGFQSGHVADLNAQVARDNAFLIKDQADAFGATGSQMADIRATSDQYRVGFNLDRTITKQQAYFANDHLDPLGVSPLLFAGASAAQAEVDKGLIRARAVSEKADVATQVANLYGKAASEFSQSNAQTAKAASDRMAGYFGAATALLAPAAKWPGLSGNSAAGDGSTFFPSQSFLQSDVFMASI